MLLRILWAFAVVLLFMNACYANSVQNVISAKRYLQVSAVVSNPRTENAEIECWRFKQPFYEYPTVGKALRLGDMSNMTYVVLPPRSREGIHKPPHPMFFILLSGKAHVTLPVGKNDLWIIEGVNPLIVATDITGIGHYTEYPSDQETVALQVPFANGVIPQHEVMAHEACPHLEEDY